MQIREHLQFLKDHQPMPDEPDAEIMARYDAALDFFYRHPDPACIPLFLNSFGEWDDFTIYERVQYMLSRFPNATVVPHLLQAMASPHRGVRLWTADTACRFPDDALVPALTRLMKESGLDMRLVAAAALERIDSPAAQAAAASLLEQETEEEVREILAGINAV